MFSMDNVFSEVLEKVEGCFARYYCLFQIPAGENGHNFALKNANFFFKISKLQPMITS